MPARPEEDFPALAGRLYDEHGAGLYRYALMLLADPAGAEDVVQQVFASLLRGGHRAEAGKDAHYVRDATSYTIYSVGPDREDNGGDLASELRAVIERGWGRRTIRGRDHGVRVLLDRPR